MLDTNVISELNRPDPHPGVIRWLDSIPEGQLTVCVLTLGEIQSRISKLPSGRKKSDIARWFTSLKESFRNQILTIKGRTALKWGELSSFSARYGKTLPVINGLIAACTLVNSAVLGIRTLRFELIQFINR